MNRRKFVIATIGAVAVVGALRWVFTTEKGGIVGTLHKRLSYLDLDPAGVDRFAADFIAQKVIPAKKLRAVDAIMPMYDQVVSLVGHSAATVLRHGEEQIVTAYLVGSDFFVNGADTSRTVHYVRWWDTHLACANPFARTVMS
jgi:hypothetical protein